MAAPFAKLAVLLSIVCWHLSLHAATAQGSCAFDRCLNGYDVVGVDIRKITSQSNASCANLCCQEPLCSFYVTDVSGGCYLKRNAGAEVPKSTVRAACFKGAERSSPVCTPLMSREECHRQTLQAVYDLTFGLAGLNTTYDTIQRLSALVTDDTVLNIDIGGVWAGPLAVEYLAVYNYIVGSLGAVAGMTFDRFIDSGPLTYARLRLSTLGVNPLDGSVTPGVAVIDTVSRFNEQGLLARHEMNLPLLTTALVSRGFFEGSPILAFVRSRVIPQICGASALFCDGQAVTRQYVNETDCEAFLSTLPSFGLGMTLLGNSLACRAVHSAFLPFDPSVHCAHIGRSGGDMCVDMPYVYSSYINVFPPGTFLD